MLSPAVLAILDRVTDPVPDLLVQAETAAASVCEALDEVQGRKSAAERLALGQARAAATELYTLIDQLREHLGSPS